jgi:hypothetical protein
MKIQEFDKFNNPTTFDAIRAERAYKNEHGEVCRSTSIEPADPNDPSEERGHLVISGKHRIGFDPRTHKAWVKEGEVIIAPLPLEAKAAA